MSKTILITGASGGIGSAVARSLAENNTLILQYNNNQKVIESIQQELIEKAAKIILIQADLSEEDGYKRVVQEVQANVDHLDVLLNVAGYLGKHQPETSVDWLDWDKTFHINVLSVFALTKACQSLLKKGDNACVINFNSIASASGAAAGQPEYYNFISYAASKGAVNVLTRGLANILAPDIRVNAISPGVFPSNIHKAFFITNNEVDLKNQFNEFVESCAKVTPLQRNGEMSDIVSAVDFLIDNKFMTGESININGGLLME